MDVAEEEEDKTAKSNDCKGIEKRTVVKVNAKWLYDPFVLFIE